MYHSKLMLYLLWRNEDTDILGGYTSFKARYDNLFDDVLANEHRYSQNATIIEDGCSQLQQQAWDQLALGADNQQARDHMQGVEDRSHQYRARRP